MLLETSATLLPFLDSSPKILCLPSFYVTIDGGSLFSCTSYLKRKEFLMSNDKLTLLLMAGLPGAGKSTLARELSRELKWHVVDKDMYREVILKQGWDYEHAARTAYELSFAIARDVLTKQQASVIFDSAALQHFVLENALHIAHSLANVQIKIILCVADRDLRNHRLRNRPWQPVTVQADPATIADYLRLYEHLSSDTLILYTNTSFAEYFEIAKEYLTGETK